MIPWDVASEMHLRVRWAEGLSVAKIAAQMHRTKKSVALKAKRMGLTPRSTLIVRDDRHEAGGVKWEIYEDDFRIRWESGEPATDMGRVYGCSSTTIAKHAKQLGLKPRLIVADRRRDKSGPQPKPPAAITVRAPVSAPVYVPPYIPPRTFAAKECQFPLWNDKERSTGLFCNAESEKDFSYCAHHRAICHPRHRVTEAFTARPGAFVFGEAA